MRKRRTCAVLACVSLTIMVVTIASIDPGCTQNYPERSVRIIVPTAPRGSIDTTARVRCGVSWAT